MSSTNLHERAAIPTANLRPGTLAEAIRCASVDPSGFGFALAEFLDEFYRDEDGGARACRLTEEPPFLHDARLDAYVGGVAEHLHRRWHLPGDPPRWTEKPERFLRRPWFPGIANAMKPFLLAESPLAFRRRFIFVEAEPLRRARMPRDERWWAYETLRSGLTRESAG